MVAPTGVNEGTPGEPATTGSPQPVTAGLEQAEAATERVPAEAVPAQAEPEAAAYGAAEAANAEPQRAESENDEARAGEAGLVTSGMAEPELAQAELAEPDLAEAEPAKPDLADAEPAAQEAAGAQDAAEVQEASRDVGPLAVVGIIVGVIILVGVAAGVLAMVTHGFKPKTLVTYRPAAVYGLRPGQCVDAGANSLSFTLVSCASSHDAEVFARFSLPAAAWPGSSAVRQQAGDGCASRLSGYLNPQLASIGLTQEYVYPNREAWQAGQRTVVCEVSSGNGRLTGSVRAKS